MAIVYKITCLPTGKVYIGWTKLSLDKRWKRHVICDKENCYIQNCIKKYGADNFAIEQLFEFENNDEAKAKEIELISSMKLNISRYPSGNGMNMTDGGEGTIGYKFSDDHKRKISEKAKGRKQSAQHSENIRLSKLGNKNPMYGRRASEKQKESARKRFKENNPNGKGELSVNYGKQGYWAGKKIPKDVVKKRADGMRGKKRKKRTTEQNERNKIKQIEWLSKNPHPMLGKKFSDESRAKMRASRLAYVEKKKLEKNAGQLELVLL